MVSVPRVGGEHALKLLFLLLCGKPTQNPQDSRYFFYASCSFTILVKLLRFSLIACFVFTLTFFFYSFQVQTLLQQMQDKFQTMSDQIIGRNILLHIVIADLTVAELSGIQQLCVRSENLIHASQLDRLFKNDFVLILILDEMSTRIDDLEKNISDLMTQAGVDELEEEIKVTETSGTA